MEHDHPDTVSSRYYLGCTYYAQCNYEQAEPLLKQTLTIREKCLGNDHPDTNETRNILAQCYSAQGKHEQAKLLNQHLETVLPVSVRDEQAKPEQRAKARQEKPLENPA